MLRISLRIPLFHTPPGHLFFSSYFKRILETQSTSTFVEVILQSSIGTHQDVLFVEMMITTDPTDPSPNPRDGTRRLDTSQSSSRNCGHKAAGSPAYLWSVHNTAGRRYGASHAAPHVFPRPAVRSVRQSARSYPPSLPCPIRGRDD